MKRLKTTEMLGSLTKVYSYLSVLPSLMALSTVPKRKRQRYLHIQWKNEIAATFCYFSCLLVKTSHRANIYSWNIRGTFPSDIPSIFGKNSPWNSEEYSKIMFREYWIQEYSLIVRWISYECYMHFSSWIKKYNTVVVFSSG